MTKVEYSLSSHICPCALFRMIPKYNIMQNLVLVNHRIEKLSSPGPQGFLGNVRHFPHFCSLTKCKKRKLV